jgi:glycosyltransferase involved in cell wall biosynthesis
MKRILIYSQSQISRDPRVFKQIDCLSKEYEITSVGYGDLEYKTVNHINILKNGNRFGQKGLFNKLRNARNEKRLVYTLLSRIMRYLPSWFPFVHTILKDLLVMNSAQVQILKKELASKPYDLIIANDFTALPVCVSASGRTKILYDAHEYTPGQSNHDRNWVRERLPYIEYALKKYLPLCENIITVCDNIAEEYKNKFTIERPLVIRNAAPYVDLAPVSRDDGRIKLVHHGVAARQRAIEVMIDVMRELDDRFELYMYLVYKDHKYYYELKNMAKDCDRIHFLEAVPMSKIVSTINRYDIGMYILPPKNFNQLNALPNKLFEFVQARLCVAIAPSVEMAAIVRKYNLGVVATEFTATAMASALSGLDFDQIRTFKQSANEHAMELSAENEMRKLEGIVDSLISQQNREEII